ncbi:hypothetical protein QC763_301340 [Podospora pseudopauciseta]|uniref:TNT domain-containing protein n=2 Tax=Podospora TaxID=5144 RepID=A0ABR0HEQ9_9PEZI|nr:hypothetical protein QC763_301340 [Podospora pseudopauciseta]KAK4677730.1 hypothetical protein QC764_301340 [Podospora pseudoanserina]
MIRQLLLAALPLVLANPLPVPEEAANADVAAAADIALPPHWHQGGRGSSSSSSTCGKLNGPRYCKGTAYDPSQTNKYLCGDSRLGPTRLPRREPLDSITEFYDRFGGLCPGVFLDTWFNVTGTGWWWYPEENGFVLGDSGLPIVGEVTLGRGTLLDRFGGETGTFVSPAGAGYQQRALPPTNLNTPADTGVPYNYHVYSVLVPFVVRSGPIRPWFGQPGNGVQFELPKTVAELIVDGVLKAEDVRIVLL